MISAALADNTDPVKGMAAPIAPAALNAIDGATVGLGMLHLTARAPESSKLDIEVRT